MMPQKRVVLLFLTSTWFLACTCAASVALAQLPEPTLQQRITQARENFRPLSENNVAERRNQLLQALSQLDQLLARSRPAYAAGWKQYLKWEQLQVSLASDEAADVDLLRDVYDRFRRNNNGLEKQQFLQVRDRLRDYLAALQIAGEGNLQDNYVAALDSLGQRIEKYEASPTGNDGPEIARTLAWLQNSGQAPDLVAAVERRFNQPNLYAHAAERFVAVGFNDSIDRTAPVNDVILGTTLRGTARFLATQQLDAIPSQRDARLNLLVRGNIYSNNLGYNGPVTIRSTGVTSAYATKQLVINENGVLAVPAVCACRTHSTIHDICAKCGLIERIAWKKAGQQKPQAEVIGSSRAAARLNASIDREASGQLALANQQLREKFRLPLLRRGYATRQMQASSDHDSVDLQMLQMGPGQMAAPSQPPASVSSNYDVAVEAHESIVVNFSEAVIGGVELTDERLARMMLEATGSVPEELQITEDKDPWSITFAENYPIAATFDGNQFRLALRANRFTRGRNDDGTVDQDVRGLVEISATYGIEKTDAGAKLTRQGDLNVEFVGQEKLGVAQVGTKTFLRRKFGALFKPEFAGEGLKLKGRWQQAGTLKLQDVKLNDGWIAIAWRAE